MEQKTELNLKSTSCKRMHNESFGCKILSVISGVQMSKTQVLSIEEKLGKRLPKEHPRGMGDHSSLKTVNKYFFC